MNTHRYMTLPQLSTNDFYLPKMYDGVANIHTHAGHALCNYHLHQHKSAITRKDHHIAFSRIGLMAE